MWLSRNQLICNQHPGMPRSKDCSAGFIKHLRTANCLWRLERDTGVKILAYSSKLWRYEDHFPALPPSLPHFFSFASPWMPGVPSKFAGIMPCMFGYLKEFMIVLNKRPHQWPNSSQKDVSFILTKQTELTQSNIPHQHWHIFKIRDKERKLE